MRSPEIKSAMQRELTIFNDEGENVKPGVRSQVSGKTLIDFVFPET